MPQVEFDTLPTSARVWVFGAAAPVTGAARDALLEAVDTHLAQWRAHGVPLVCARDWREDRFLAIGVDEAATGASGCSIDGLFRVLAAVEPSVGTSMLEGATVFWRAEDGAVQSSDRPGFRQRAAQGAVSTGTPVFDTTVNTVGGWRDAFERTAATSWHARLISR